jgi:glutathione peroxidase-family protein
VRFAARGGAAALLARPPSPPAPPPTLAFAEFGSQEPGDNSEILNCVKYVRPGNGYVIPSAMSFSQKGDVNGLFATPLFKSLKADCGGADVGWNFEMWVLDKKGVPYKRYTTGPGPEAAKADIDLLLAQ